MTAVVLDIGPVARSGRVAGVEWTAIGEGLPVTVFAHGLAGSQAEVRPLASRTAGTRVLLSFRGHGGSDPLDGGWDFDGLADDLLAVANEVGATRAVGLSLGAGALLRVVASHPGRFERLAFVMPASLDQVRDDRATAWLLRLAAAIDGRDEDAIAALLLLEVPAAVRERTGARLLVQRRARQLASGPPPRPAGQVRPLEDLACLADVTAPALVVGQQDDDLHPLEVARTLATALPRADLLELPEGGVFWTASREAAQAVADHLREVPGR
jgi:3-oxoadipate enol-lactonase